MSIIDVIIFIFLGFGFLLGFKRGIISSAVSCIGMFLVVILSFMLRNPVSNFLYEHLPFFHFFGLFREISILNILLYEGIAFIFLFILFTILFKIIVKISKLLDKLIKMTIILTIPSKIAGGIFGFIEYYLLFFVLLFFLNLPIFDIPELENSKMKEFMLTKTPIVSEEAKKYNDVANEFIELKNKSDQEDKEKLHLETIDLFLKYNIVSVETMEKLVDEGKIEIEDIEKTIEKYKKD